MSFIMYKDPTWFNMYLDELFNGYAIATPLIMAVFTNNVEVYCQKRLQ